MATIIHIEATSDFLLYTKFVVILLVPLLTTMQLFDDILLFALVIATLMSLVAIVVTTNLI